ncbi:MAG: T9SS type A sorting domain-containing protein [Bacteroidales bacterium]|nr:T9SS type A sorting domain-containing protein [Bacteroidales bacterium]
MRIKNFTFFTAIIAIFALATPQNTYSQVYQFENPGFEQWDGGSADEPTGWNSYPSANCTMLVGCSTAKQKRHERSNDTRPGSTGQYSCMIFAKSVLGVVANGALTSGQMQLVSLNTSSASNGNRTIQSNNDFNHRLNAKPDSIVFWAKVVNASDGSQACCHLYIHDNFNLQDPLGGNEDSNFKSHIIGMVPSYNFTNNGSTWQRHSTPIRYDGDTCRSTNDPEYILITFSTNYLAMQGANNDKLYIDDIELIYNANLSSITVNGQNIPNFNQNTTEYYVDVECGGTNYISATTASPRASYTTSLSSDGKTATITVNHGDKTKTYTVHYHPAVTTQIADHICKGDSYSQNGFTIPMQNNAGTFSFSNSYPLANGCDSVVELNLTVNPTYNTNVDLTICSSATYDFHGQIVDQPGTYYTTLTSQYGCDSTITLNLAVDSYYQVNLNEHICEGDMSTTPGFEGRADAGIDTLFLTATNSCDSLVVLVLEVGRIDNVELEDSIEVDNKYSNYGFDIAAIHEAGEVTFTNTLTNTDGCDSIVTLRLKVLPKPVTPEPEPTPEVVTFDIFPNPTSTGQITIEANYDITKDIYEYQIFNEHGMLMDTGCINSKDTFVDVSKYNSGYYYLKVLVGDTVKAQKKRKAIKFVVTN